MRTGCEADGKGRLERGGLAGPGRRRWSDDEKLRIVEESYLGSRAGSATARRYGISDQLLWTWRKAKRDGRLGGVAGFVAVKLATAEEPGVDVGIGSGGGRIEIVSANGRRVIVDCAVDVARLVGIVQALERLQ